MEDNPIATTSAAAVAAATTATTTAIEMTTTTPTIINNIDPNKPTKIDDVGSILEVVCVDLKSALCCIMHDILLLAFGRPCHSNALLFVSSTKPQVEACCLRCAEVLVQHAGHALRYLNATCAQIEDVLTSEMGNMLQIRQQLVRQQQHEVASPDEPLRFEWFEIDDVNEIFRPTLYAREIDMQNHHPATASLADVRAVCSMIANTLHTGMATMYAAASKFASDSIIEYIADAMHVASPPDDTATADDLDVTDRCLGFNSFSRTVSCNIRVLFELTLPSIMFDVIQTIEHQLTQCAALINNQTMISMFSSPHTDHYWSMYMQHALHNKPDDINSATMCIANGANPLFHTLSNNQTCLDIVIAAEPNKHTGVETVLSLLVHTIVSRPPIDKPECLSVNTVFSVMRLAIDVQLLGKVQPNSEEHVALVAGLCTACPMVFWKLSGTYLSPAIHFVSNLFARATEASWTRFGAIYTSLVQNGLGVSSHDIINTLQEFLTTSGTAKATTQQEHQRELLASLHQTAQVRGATLVYNYLASQATLAQDVATMLAYNPRSLLAGTSPSIDHHHHHQPRSPTVACLVTAKNWDVLAMVTQALFLNQGVITAADSDLVPIINDIQAIDPPSHYELVSILAAHGPNSTPSLSDAIMLDPGMALNTVVIAEMVPPAAGTMPLIPDDCLKLISTLINTDDIDVLAALCCHKIRVSDQDELLRVLLTTRHTTSLWGSRLVYNTMNNHNLAQSLPLDFRRALMAHILGMFHIVDTSVLDLHSITLAIKSALPLTAGTLTLAAAIDPTSVVSSKLPSAITLLEQHTVYTLTTPMKHTSVIPPRYPYPLFDRIPASCATFNLLYKITLKLRSIASDRGISIPPTPSSILQLLDQTTSLCHLIPHHQ